MKSIKGIDLRHLLYFLAVAEHGNFSKAAMNLHMAQPPLSQQIKDLEVRIGARLFIRDKRHVALSEAGRALLPEAKAIIARTQSAVQHARNVGQGHAGHLRIGMMSTAPHNPQILDLLRRFSQKFPDVLVDLAVMSSLEQRDALAADAIDLALHWPSWDERKHRDFTTWHFPPYRFGLAMPKHHVLCRRGTVDIRNLADATWFVTGERHNRAWRNFTLAFFRAAKFTPVQLVEKNPAPLILTYVAAGQGVALLPDFMAATSPGVHFAPLPAMRNLSPEISLCLSKKKLHKEGLTTNFYALATDVKAKIF